MDTFALGSPLGPVLADIIMIKLESTIVKELVDKSLVKLYMRYVDDTLLLVKDKDINCIHKRLNSLVKILNLQLTPSQMVTYISQISKLIKIILTFTIKILIQDNTQASTAKHPGA